MAVRIAARVALLLLAFGRLDCSIALSTTIVKNNNNNTSSTDNNNSTAANQSLPLQVAPKVAQKQQTAELSAKSANQAALASFELPQREELDLLEYIEKLNVKYKNQSAPSADFEERKQTNLQETTIEIVKQLIATTAAPQTASSSAAVAADTSENTPTSPSPPRLIANSSAAHLPQQASADPLANDNDAVESKWQYGIFDRFTRARSTTLAPTAEPSPATLDVRSFNTDECGLKFYEGGYSTGKVGDYNVAAMAPSSAFGVDESSPNEKPSAREKYTAEEQNKLRKSFLQSAQQTFDDDNYSHYPNQNQNHPHTDTANLGLKHDWNKELFGHEEPYSGGQRATSAAQSSAGDSDFNLSSKRNWRQQQLGQTLQHLGFDVSELMSMRSQQNVHSSPRENLMKMSSAAPKAQKSAAVATSVSLREQSDTLKLEPRVIGGTDARLGDSPWAVSLQALVSRPGTGAVEYRHYCGGTLINERHVLTAAHCLDFMVGRESRLFVVVGDLQWRMTASLPYGRRIPIEKLTIHAGYKSTAFGHDIGLIKLKEPVYPVKVNGRYVVNSVCLPERNIEHTGDAELVGWGLFSNRNEMADTLQIATVPILPRPLCVDLYRRRTGLIQWIIGIELITEKQVCASTFGRGICQGDSGSPLVFNERTKRYMPENGSANTSAIGTPQPFNEHTKSTIIGIVAFGGIRRCSYQSLPGVYMQTSKYMDWILPKIK